MTATTAITTANKTTTGLTQEVIEEYLQSYLSPEEKKSGKNWKDILSSKRMDWETPPPLYAAINEEFHFGLDAAASHETAKAPKYYTIEDNSLIQSWGEPGDTVWCNPPYGRGVAAFIRKGYEESLKGVTSVFLIFVRSDTEWFQTWVLGKDQNELTPADEIRFIEGRVSFVGAASSSTFPSIFVIFRPPDQRVSRIPGQITVRPFRVDRKTRGAKGKK